MGEYAKRWSWLAVIFLMTVGGCSSSYHCYPGCHVGCRYCPPPPLPYCPYKRCVCHTRQAAGYLQPRAEAVKQPASIDHRTTLTSKR